MYVFQPLEGMVVAEIALLKICKLAQQYGLGVQFVAPELIMQALIANEKVSRFGIRELDASYLICSPWRWSTPRIVERPRCDWPSVRTAGFLSDRLRDIATKPVDRLSH